jgi:hypothetical protein
MAPDRFTIAELRHLTNTVFDALEAAGFQEMKIPPEHDYYFTVLEPFTLDKAPEDAPVGAGQVTDDLLDLRGEVSRYLSDDPEDMLNPWHACMHLAGLVGYLSSATHDVAFVEGPNAKVPAEHADG